MDKFDFQDLSAEIRRMLKEQSKTYRDLAIFLKISESSVKKQLIAHDCSLSRLTMICDFLKIQMNDLFEAHKTKPRIMKFTESQEKFLIENEKCLHIYWKLVYETWSVEKIKKQFGISDLQMFKSLRELDKQGLLELLPDGKIRFPEMKMVFWENKGRLVDKIKNQWSVEMIRKINEGEGKPGHHLAVRMYKLRPETQREFIQASEAVFLEFAHRSIREARLYKNEVEIVGLVAGFAPRSFVEKI